MTLQHQPLEQALQRVLARIRQAETAAGRPAGSVRLLAVSKTHGAQLIRRAWDCGQRCFGENYLQEALRKQEELKDLAIQWHYIGRIQSNKTRPIAEHFDWVHGLSDVRHAQRLSSQRPEHLEPLNLCIQVNTSGETSKGGLQPEAVAELALAVRELPNLRLRGLMTIPAPAETDEARRRPLQRLRSLREELNASGIAMDTLSMGMSADLEQAVAEGADIVRIGTAIFGQRNHVEH